jgi:16S rRNA G1207 methylase RsmC
MSQAHAESKAEGLEDQLRRYKTQFDEVTRQNLDLNNLKARLTQENFELQRQVQELDTSNAALAKAKSQLQAQLDEAKARLDEETRVTVILKLIEASRQRTSLRSVCV